MSKELPPCPADWGFLDSRGGSSSKGNVGVMPRQAVERLFLLIVVALSAVQAVACDSAGPSTPDSGSGSGMDASQDAAVESGAGGGDAATEAGLDDSGGFMPPSGEYCVVRIAAECDGPEDCPNNKCCGARFEPTDVSYTAIECSSECDFQRVFPLCHAGQICTAAGDRTCRSSFLIPDGFIGICALPNNQPEPTGEPVAGMIDCGPHQCIVGTEQCCLREGFDIDKFQSVPHEPYCAPIGEPCGCYTEVPPRDAAVPDDDAGAP